MLNLHETRSFGTEHRQRPIAIGLFEIPREAERITLDHIEYDRFFDIVIPATVNDRRSDVQSVTSRSEPEWP